MAILRKESDLMPIYKTKTPTKDGRAWFFKVGYTDVFGNYKQKTSKKYATQREAKLEMARFIDDQSKNKCPDEMTFRQLYDRFRDYQDDKIRETTKYNYRNKLKYLEDFMDVKCRDYNIEMFEEWKKKLNSNPELGTGTKNDILKFWKSILNYGISWYNFNFLPTYRKMTNFTNPNELKKEMDFYSYEEFKHYISFEDDLRLRCLWETLYYCGLRCGEARGLTWDCVDLKNKRLSVTKQVLSNKYSGSGEYYIGMPKTRDSYRTIPMCDALVNDLLEYHAIVSKKRNFNSGFFVFGNECGIIPFNPSTIRDYNKRNAERAELKSIRLHDFRHSCASLLINNGASVTMVAKYLGHTKIDETLNTYSHMFQSALDGVLNIINDLNSI